MLQQTKQASITYLTHRWVMAGLAAWLLLVVVPQLVTGLVIESPHPSLAYPNTLLVGLPLLFLSMMLVPQAKAQFGHPRAALMPRFNAPHLAVPAALLIVLVIVYPLLAASSYRFDRLGMCALAAAIAVPAVWAAHSNSLLAMLVAMAAFFSSMTRAGADWWIHQADAHRLVHATIVVVGYGLLVAWLRRLSILREEMDDYQSLVQWRAARKSGAEVSDQRRIVAEQFRRSRLTSWISDTWLAQVGGYHQGRPFRLARLLRYGFGQPAEVGALAMTIWFAAITFFLAKYGYSSSGPSGFGAIQFCLQMAVIFPGFIPSELLAQRKPRVAVELLRPIPRSQLVDGLFAATLWQWAALWLIMNAGAVIVAWLMVEGLTPAIIGMILLLSCASSLAMASLGLRAAIWPSFLKRFAVLMLAIMVLQAPIVAYSALSNKVSEVVLLSFLLLDAVLIALAVVVVRRARRAWLDLELG